jgi:hypothetical protein
MKVETLRNHLNELSEIQFMLPDGSFVPPHFHLTEIGLNQKQFIDCGGTIRNEKTASLQLWFAGDTEHRLSPKKFIDIIDLSQEKLQIGNPEIEVEYQQGTIGKFTLSFKGSSFQLENTQTDCLASDKCGIPPEKLKRPLESLAVAESSCCTPGGGCC